MALQAAYKTFLASPSSDALAADCSINYLPTLSTIKEPSPVLKHLTTQEQQLKKKDEKILHAIEGERDLCVETETTIQFLLGGGAYLPGLDDNFLVDKIATLPIIHIVAFDQAQKIKSIRLSWDQGCLLRAIDVIGARGRNWPIRDGKDQARLIASALPANASSADEERTGRRQSRAGGANADPHSSLANTLFAARDLTREESPQNIVSPRMSAKPAPREWGDLFAGAEENGVPASASATRSPSPKKPADNPLKLGAGKNYHGNRLFDVHENTPEITVKMNPKKFEHFEFGEGTIPAPSPSKPSKHGPTFDFSDFATPQKPRVVKTQPNNERHFGWSDDEEEARKPNSWRQHVPKPRKDALTHFDFNDESPQVSEQSKLRSHPKGSSLYQDQADRDGTDLTTYENAPKDAAGRGTTNNPESYKKNFGSHFDISDKQAAPADDAPQEKMPLGNITNMTQQNTTQYNKNFDAHFAFTDTSSPATKDQGGNENAGITESRKLAAKTLSTNWALGDDSPEREPQMIKTTGNGMGSRNNGEKKWWEFGE